MNMWRGPAARAVAAACVMAASAAPVAVCAESSDAPVIPDDRRIRWMPGIPGGIPQYPVFADVRDAPYGAAGDGQADDTRAIQGAVDACPEGAAVYLPEGNYRLTGPIRITRGVVLRGDGPVRSRLVNVATAGHVILIGEGDNGIRTRVIGGHNRGSTVIEVEDASRIRKGDLLLVDQLNDPDLVDNVGCGGVCGWAGGENGTRAMGQLVQVTGRQDNALTLSRPLYYTFRDSLQPAATRMTDRAVARAGVEDLYVAMTRPHTDTSSPIKIWNAVHCWVRNVEASGGWFGGHVTLQSSLGCEVRDSYVHHPLSFGGGYGYGVWVFAKSTDTLVENNICYHLHAGMMLECAGPGNVFGYNFSSRMFGRDYPETDWAHNDISMHGAHSYLNLFEGNWVSVIGLDFYWGSASHTTLFRNHADMECRTLDGRPMLAVMGMRVDAGNYFMNAVGNVFGRAGCEGIVEADVPDYRRKMVWRLGYRTPSGSGEPDDLRVAQTLLRHGNFDHISGQTRWDPAIPGRVLPPSLYLAARPAFFGDLPWPPIGPDLDPMAGTIPARARFLRVPRAERDAEDQVYLGGFLLRVGKQEEGRAALRRVLEAHADTRFAGEARRLLAGIE